ncbi:MAG: UDP-3-O-(3-hydroxymyristoyl)glucosamine N-acyltransferase [Bacteroidota bacterium]
MKFKVGEIAQLIGAKVDGDPNVEITGLAKIEEGKPGTITFFANPKYESHIYTTSASAIIVPTDFALKSAVAATLLRTPDPYSAFTTLLGKASEMLQAKTGIESADHSYISESAQIGEDVYIGAFAYIGNGAKIGPGAKIYPHAYIGDHVSVGANTTIYANASVYLGCQIGANCIVHSGAVIGSDGFGFAPQKDGSYRKIPQTGIVQIEDNVEIGAGCTIDRATLGATIIRKGVKLDNLIQIAHNVEIGADTVIAAQTGVSGSTKLGKRCMVGGQVGIVGHLNLADQTSIGAQSGVSKSVQETGKALRGSPAQDYRQQLKSEVLFKNLEAMERRIRTLEQQLKNQERG